MSSLNLSGAGLIVALVAPVAAHAQNIPAAQGAARDSAESAPSLVTPAMAARLGPIKWMYVTTLVTGEGTPQRIGFRTLSLTNATYQGTPAWLLIDSRQMHTVTYAESLYVSKADLSPLHSIRHTPTGEVVSKYGKDSVRATFDDDSGRVVQAIASEPGLAANMYLLEALVGAAPLGEKWVASARLAAIGRDGSGVIPVETRVLGEERVNIPDGAFDAWVLSMRIGSGEERLWVRKGDGVVIKEELPVVGMAGARVQLLLGLKGVGR